jgi:hypothetical protein
MSESGRESAYLNAIKQALQALEWTEGRNVRFELRFVVGNDPNVARPYAAEQLGAPAFR